MATYLQLVNEVLTRLREDSVATVSQTAYSRLIGLYVNDAKRQVEDSWDWDVLSVNTPVVTAPGVTTYTVTGSGTRQKSINVNITTIGNQTPVRQVPIKWIQDQQQLTTVQSSRPVYFAWNGNNGTDCQIEVFPTPNGAYTLMFNMTVPQVKLSADTDVMLVADEPVIAGAFARALVERGEDGGLNSGEAYSLFKSVLSDYIAIETSHDESYSQFVVT